jgi:hypothetical protein
VSGQRWRDVQIWLIAARKRDEAAAALRKQQKHAAKSQDPDVVALHMAKTAHGLVRGLHGMLPSHLQDASLRRHRTEAPDWQRNGHTLEEVKRGRAGHKGTREYVTGTTDALRINR